MMEDHPILKKYPELIELVRVIKTEVQRNQRPANETILHDEDIMRILGVSKRKIEYMKANGEIPYFNPPMQRDYYLLSDILNWLEKYKHETIVGRRRI